MKNKTLKITNLPKQIKLTLQILLNLKSSTFRKKIKIKNLISNKELEKHINPFAHVQCIHKDRELINSKYMNHEPRTMHEQCINSTVCTKADIWVGWRVTIYYELREEYYTYKLFCQRFSKA